MEKWFWLWLSLKKGKQPTKIENVDEEIVSALIDLAYQSKLPKGDGKFSRLENYIESLLECVKLLKANFTGKDKIFLAFLLGFEVSLELAEKMAERIKKGR